MTIAKPDARDRVVLHIALLAVGGSSCLSRNTGKQANLPVNPRKCQPQLNQYSKPTWQALPRKISGDAPGGAYILVASGFANHTKKTEMKDG